MKRFLLLLWFLIMAAITMFGQDSVDIMEPGEDGIFRRSRTEATGYKSRYDTSRVKMLVTYANGSTRNISFTINGYTVRKIWPEGNHAILVSYLDDRKRPLKNLDVWIAKPHSH